MTQSKQEKAIAIAMKNLGKNQRPPDKVRVGMMRLEELGSKDPFTPYGAVNRGYLANQDKLLENFIEKGYLINKPDDDEIIAQKEFEKRAKLEKELEKEAQLESLKAFPVKITNIKNKAYDKHPIVEYRSETKKGNNDELAEIILQGKLKENLIDSQTDNKGYIMIYDHGAEKFELYNPNEVNVSSLGNNQLALVAPSKHGGHNNYKIIDIEKSPELKYNVRKILGDSYRPTNSLTDNLSTKSIKMQKLFDS